MATAVMNIGTKVTQGHSDRGWMKIFKNIGIVLNTITTSVMKDSTMVRYFKAFHGMPVQLTYMQGHNFFCRKF